MPFHSPHIPTTPPDSYWGSRYSLNDRPHRDVHPKDLETCFVYEGFPDESEKITNNNFLGRVVMVWNSWSKLGANRINRNFQTANSREDHWLNERLYTLYGTRTYMKDQTGFRHVATVLQFYEEFVNKLLVSAIAVFCEVSVSAGHET